MIFFTATINSWQNLLENNKIKDLLIDSMSWLVENKKAKINAFVIMPNHIHIIWVSLENGYDIAGRFKSFTGSAIKKYLEENNAAMLANYQSTQSDRSYHIWERRSKSIEINTREIASQKVAYIHQNPLQEKWKLVEIEEDYIYSSAAFYLGENTKYKFLERYEDWI